MQKVTENTSHSLIHIEIYALVKESISAKLVSLTNTSVFTYRSNKRLKKWGKPIQFILSPCTIPNFNSRQGAHKMYSSATRMIYTLLRAGDTVKWDGDRDRKFACNIIALTSRQATNLGLTRRSKLRTGDIAWAEYCCVIVGKLTARHVTTVSHAWESDHVNCT